MVERKLELSGYGNCEEAITETGFPGRFKRSTTKISMVSWVSAASWASAMSWISTWFCFLILALAGSSSLQAQYNSPVGKGSNDHIPSKEGLDKAYKQSRWSIGPFRAQPWIGVKNASLVTLQTQQGDELLETEDFTITVGAGLRGYMRTSPKLVLAVHALPEYVWWQDTQDKRSLNGRYGIGIFGFFNRLKLEISSRRSERQDLFSTEVQQLTSLRREVSRIGAEVEVARGIQVYARAQFQDIGSKGDDLELFDALNRSEDSVLIGAKAKSPRGFELDLGYKETEIDFENQARPLSSESSSILLDLGYRSKKLDGTLSFEQLQLDPQGASILESIEEQIGNVELTWKPNRSLEFVIFSRRDLTYSISSSSTHLISDRLGLTTRLLGNRSSLELSYSDGQDDFEGGGSQRIDDVTELRATLRLPIGDMLTVAIHGSSFDYDSNNNAFDREFSSYGMSLDLGKLAEKLSLGNAESDW